MNIWIPTYLHKIFFPPIMILTDWLTVNQLFSRLSQIHYYHGKLKRITQEYKVNLWWKNLNLPTMMKFLTAKKSLYKIDKPRFSNFVTFCISTYQTTPPHICCLPSDALSSIMLYILPVTKRILLETEELYPI